MGEVDEEGPERSDDHKRAKPGELLGYPHNCAHARSV